VAPQQEYGPGNKQCADNGYTSDIDGCRYHFHSFLQEIENAVEKQTQLAG
jgi:hypothetical protein